MTAGQQVDGFDISTSRKRLLFAGASQCSINTQISAVSKHVGRHEFRDMFRGQGRIEEQGQNQVT